MAESHRSGLAEKDIDQAITLLKKGSYLLKYGRRGKPKFCPFHLSNDESMLIWYSGNEQRHLKLNQVSRIIPGQRTAIFQRYPRPEKEYQSFSLICNDRSLDLICKDKDEAEVWLVGLKALTTRGSHNKWKLDTINCSTTSESPRARIRKTSPSVAPFDYGDTQETQVALENVSNNALGKAFSDIISYTAAVNTNSQAESVSFSSSPLTDAFPENSNDRSSAAETFRVSLSSIVSSSSHGSAVHENFDSLADVFICGEGVADGILGGGEHKVGHSYSPATDALLPQAVESTMVLDVNNIACGARHAVLVTKQGEIFSWGEESGGRLGHGIDTDVSYPKLIETLNGVNVESVACGEYHTCAVTRTGDLYSWGDGTYNCGLLGHGSNVSHWIPRKVGGYMDGIHVSCISCGPWHTAVVTSAGQLFTFGDGSFGALGHGDHISTSIPREVETLIGLQTTRVSCGVWHTAAVVQVVTESSSSSPPRSPSFGKLFTWGDGDKGRLGHGDERPRLFPECVDSLIDENVCQVACGHNLSVALTTSGHVYTMGSTAYGQLGVPAANGLVPTRVEGEIYKSFVEDIACGAYHVAALTSTAKVYTWGKGENGQLGHGDKVDRKLPTLVDFLKDKQVKRIVCGLNFTAIICLHKWVSSVDHSVCSSCHNPFGFRRKRHNCYNCGLVFCKACSSRKSLKAALAPSVNKPYRVCDDCFNKIKKTDTKLKKTIVFAPDTRNSRVRNGNLNHKIVEVGDKEAQGPRLQEQVSRFSSIDSTKQTERTFKQNLKLELQDNHVFPGNKNLQMGRIYCPKASIFLAHSSTKKSSASASGSRLSSMATSPVSGKSSSARSSGVTVDDSKQMNDSLNQEIIKLRAQVEELTFKSEHLEAELQRTSKQLKTVTAIAEDEAKRNKSAKEVIKTLTVQVKEMAARSPEGENPSVTSGSTAKRQSSTRTTFSTESHKTSTTASGKESNNNSAHQNLSHGTKTQTEKKEQTLQAEPGVYITLSTVPGGANEVKRVRFSRKHFTEQEAEKWWSENGSRVCERYQIQCSH